MNEAVAPGKAGTGAPRGRTPARTIRWSDLLGLATGSLQTNRLRSALTIGGITIGVFSVVGVMTALTAVNRSIQTGLSFLGANTFEIGKYPAIMINDGWWNYRNRPSITVRQGNRLKEILEPATGSLVTLSLSDDGERVHYGDRRTSSNKVVVGTNENYLATANYELAIGRNLTVEDNLFNRPVAVVGYDIEQELFPFENPLGKRVTVEGQRYEIVGVLERRGSVFGQSLDGMFLIPVGRFMVAHYNQWQTVSLSVKAPDAESFGTVQDEAVGAMRLVRGLEPEEPNNFEIYSNDSLRAAFDKIAVIVGTGGLIISAIALLTAGVGIMNIMLVSVTERTREIGVRKSLGARGKDLLIQFLLEAVFLCELGALVGILLGVAGGNAAAQFFKVPMIFPWFWAGVAVVVCSAIGITFGLYPAWKAARLNPIDALRYE